MKKVIIFGTGAFAQVVHSYLTYDSDYEVVAFTIHQDHLDKQDKELFGFPVVPFEICNEKYPTDEYAMFVAMGYRDANKIRAQIYQEAKNKGYELISYIHSGIKLWPSNTIGDNCFIFENNTIQPFTTIGNNVVLWSGNHIGHHVTICDHCFIASHVVVSGQVEIGPYCFIGVNATFRDSIKIAERCIIGAGALIMRHTNPGEVYVGERTPPRKNPS